MRVLITGAGRGGTNLLSEMVRASGAFQNYYPEQEDRQVFNYDSLPSGYGTKLTTEQYTTDQLKTVLGKYSDLQALFSVRHPYDTVLAKVFRGRPKQDGGDSQIGTTADDGTIPTAIRAVERMAITYMQLKDQHSKRVAYIKMEELITAPLDTALRVSRYLGIRPHPAMFKPGEKTYNAYHRNRYKGRLFPGQKDLYKNLDVSFDGYFKDIDLKMLSDLRPICKLFHYEI